MCTYLTQGNTFTMYMSYSLVYWRQKSWRVLGCSCQCQQPVTQHCFPYCTNQLVRDVACLTIHGCVHTFLYHCTELLVKVMLCFLYWAITYIGFSYIIRYIRTLLFVLLFYISSYRKRKPPVLFNMADKLYLIFLVVVQVYCCFLHDILGLQSRLEFLPLLLTSVSTAIGVVYSWMILYHAVLTNNFQLFYF